MLKRAAAPWAASAEIPAGGLARVASRLSEPGSGAGPGRPLATSGVAERSGATKDAPSPEHHPTTPVPGPEEPAEGLSSSPSGTALPGTPPTGPLTSLHVLILDDNAAVRRACAEITTRMGFYPTTAESVPAARAILAGQPVDLLLLDLKLPGGGGLAFLDEVHSRYPNVAVVVMTAFATVSSALEAMRSGASDYLNKPFSMEQLVEVLERASTRRIYDLDARLLRDRIRAGAAAGLGSLIGRSPAMEKLYRILGKVAFTSHPVLILGESGTGKEVVARLIHSNGPHAGKPFIPVDCGSLVPTLIESELFGHIKGAFTGAMQAKEGLLVAAGSGTVFLDEIGELPLDLQAKLLRALQEKEVRPVGATYSMPIGARILAATNQDLLAMVENGRFRKDLYFRLNVVNIHLPPLRDRKGDIPLLATHMLERLARETGKNASFSDKAMRMLEEYEWPGNVRELHHAVEHAMALSSGPVLHHADFPQEIQNYRPRRIPAGVGGHGASGEEGDDSRRVVSIAEMERRAILHTIRQLNGDKIKAARLLGIGKTTLYRKLKEYGIDPANLPDE